MASQELVPSQEPAMPVMPSGRNTRGRAQTKRTKMVEHTTQETDTPEGHHLEIHQVRQVQEVVKKVAVVRRGGRRRGTSRREEELEEEEEALEEGQEEGPSRRAMRTMDAELERAMQGELEPMGGRPGGAHRTWKRVVVEGGTAPEPAGLEEGQEDEAGAPGGSQVMPTGRVTRSQGRSQPRFHAESAQTDIPPTEALEPQVPTDVLEAAMNELESEGQEEAEGEAQELAQGRAGETTVGGTQPEEFATPPEFGSTPEDLELPQVGGTLASQEEQEEEDAGAAASPSLGRRHKAPGTDMGPSQISRRTRLFASETAPEEEEEEGQPPSRPSQQIAGGSRGVLGAVEAVGKTIRSVLGGGRTQEEQPAEKATAERQTRARASQKSKTVAAVPGVKGAKAGKGASSRKRRGGKGSEESYKRYVHRVLQQVHPQLNISSRAMEVMQSFMVDAFEKLASEAGRLTRLSQHKTLTAREVQTASRLVLPGALGEHAVKEGQKAVMRFSAAE